MNKRLLALLLAGMVFLTGLVVAQDPPAKEEPPVRLKRKKPRGDEKPAVDPDKPAEKKKDGKADEKDEDKKPELREPEPVTPQEDEKEVLQRVVSNVHRVGERLAMNDLGEATQQTQRDILKDIESLIHRNENPPPQGGGDQSEQNNGGGDDQDNQNQQGGGGQKTQKQQSGQKSPGGGSKAAGTRQKNQSKGKKSGTKSGSGSKSGKQPPSGSKPGYDKRTGKKDNKGDKPNGKNGISNQGGAGGDKDDRMLNKNADQYKDVWGHLPQTLRAQMDAYSNPQPFMPKYDDLIKRYYRTIAEQGRRKGE